MATFQDKIVLQDDVSAKLDKIVEKTRSVTQSTSKLQEKMKNFGESMKNIGKDLSLKVTTPLIAAGVASVKMASDMDETINKVDVAFGSSAQTVKEWAKTSISSMGLAQQSALDSAALYGDMATSMGLSQSQAAEMAKTLTRLGADLASFKNISNDQAQTALKSIFTGETESLKELGVVMTEVNLQQFARQQGIRKSISRMTEEQKVMLRYQYVLAKTKNAQGDFERTNEGTANQMRMVGENLKELGRLLGEIIIPYANQALKVVNGWLVSFQNLSPETRKMIVGIAAFAAALPPLIMGLGGLATVFTVLSAHPFILTIGAIVAGLAVMYKWAEMIGESFGRLGAYWDRISNADGFWNKTKAFFGVATGDEKYIGSDYRTENKNDVRGNYGLTKDNISKAQATPIPQTTNNSMNMTFNTSATVRQEADIDKIGQSLVKQFSSAYNNMGTYTPFTAK